MTAKVCNAREQVSVSVARRARPGTGLILGTLLFAAGCSTGSRAKSDGAAEDIAPELSNPCPRFSCGELCCESVARTCMPACACPEASLLPVPFQGGIRIIDPNQVPGALTAVVLFMSPTGESHTLVVGYTDKIATGMDLPLAAAGSMNTPFAAIGWRVDLVSQSVLTGLYATAGRVHFDRACTDGVAGRLLDVVFTEQLTARDQTPYPGGCSFSVAEIPFEVGTSCP